MNHSSVKENFAEKKTQESLFMTIINKNFSFLQVKKFAFDTSKPFHYKVTSIFHYMTSSLKGNNINID